MDTGAQSPSQGRTYDIQIDGCLCLWRTFVQSCEDYFCFALWDDEGRKTIFKSVAPFFDGEEKKSGKKRKAARSFVIGQGPLRLLETWYSSEVLKVRMEQAIRFCEDVCCQ